MHGAGRWRTRYDPDVHSQMSNGDNYPYIAKSPDFAVEAFCVCVTYLPGQSPRKWGPAKADGLCGVRKSQDTAGIFRLRKMEHCILRFDELSAYMCLTSVFSSAYSKKPRLCSRGFPCLRYLSSRAVARQVLSAYMCLTSVFGMGTGGPT